MKKINLPFLLTSVVFAIFLFSTITYFMLPQEGKWLITSVVDVPVCAKNIAERLEIQPDFIAVKDYIIQSLKPGMTLDEVEATLNQIAPTHTATSFVSDQGGTNTQVLIQLCDNPLGNVVLFVYYSKDGHLINVVDPYDE